MLKEIEKKILLFIRRENISGNKPDSISISSFVAEQMQITTDVPHLELCRLKKKKFVHREEALGGFNGNNWYSLLPAGNSALLLDMNASKNKSNRSS